MALVVVDMTVNVALEFLVQWKLIGKQLGLGKGRIQSMTAHMRYNTPLSEENYVLLVREYEYDRTQD